jgi:hypothetical protein
VDVFLKSSISLLCASHYLTAAAADVAVCDDDDVYFLRVGQGEIYYEKFSLSFLCVPFSTNLFAYFLTLHIMTQQR